MVMLLSRPQWSSSQFASHGTPELLKHERIINGICGGTCIAWLQHIVVLYAPSFMPTISHAFDLQVQLENHGPMIEPETIVRIGGMKVVSQACFLTLIEALTHAWRSGGYYLIILSSTDLATSHCLAFAPNGFVLNPNQGLFQVMSVEAAYSNLLLDSTVELLDIRSSKSTILLVEVSQRSHPMHARAN